MTLHTDEESPPPVSMSPEPSTVVTVENTTHPVEPRVRRSESAAICAMCGGPFMAKRAQLKRGQGKYCSRICCTDHARTAGLHKGPNSPRWQGGLSAKRTEYQRRHDQKWPERAHARKQVVQALARGEMIRMPCERCGAEKAQAHHDDYSKPLAVRWLRREHHDEHHRAMGDGKFAPVPKRDARRRKTAKPPTKGPTTA